MGHATMWKQNIATRTKDVTLNLTPTLMDEERPHGMRIRKLMLQLEMGRGSKAEEGKASIEKMTYPMATHKPTQKKRLPKNPPL